jgi:hypothetical protein
MSVLGSAGTPYVWQHLPLPVQQVPLAATRPSAVASMANCGLHTRHEGSWCFIYLTCFTCWTEQVDTAVMHLLRIQAHFEFWAEAGPSFLVFMAFLCPYSIIKSHYSFFKNIPIILQDARKRGWNGVLINPSLSYQRTPTMPMSLKTPTCKKIIFSWFNGSIMMKYWIDTDNCHL